MPVLGDCKPRTIYFPAPTASSLTQNLYRKAGSELSQASNSSFSRILGWCWEKHDQFWHSMDLYTMSVIGEALALSVRRANGLLPPGQRCDDALVQWDQFCEDWRPMLRNRPGAVAVKMTRLSVWYFLAFACKKVGRPVLWTVLAGVMMFGRAQLLRLASTPDPNYVDTVANATPTATPSFVELGGFLHGLLRNFLTASAVMLVGSWFIGTVLLVAAFFLPYAIPVVDAATVRCARAYERLCEKRASRLAQREAELAEEAARRAEAERAARRTAKKAQRRSKKTKATMHGFGAPLAAGIVEEEGEGEEEKEEQEEEGGAEEANEAEEAGEAGEADGTDGSSVATDVSDLAVASDADDDDADDPSGSEWHAVAPRRARKPKWDDAQRVYVSSLTSEALLAHEGRRFLRPEIEWDDADDTPSERMSVAASAAKSVAASTRTNTTTKIQSGLRITEHAHGRAAEPARAIDYDDPQFARDLRDGVRVRTADKSGEPSCKVIGKKYKIWLELDGKTVKSAAPLGS